MGQRERPGYATGDITDWRWKRKLFPIRPIEIIFRTLFCDQARYSVVERYFRLTLITQTKVDVVVGVVEPIGIAIVGFGKIARDQHLPAIESNPHFCLAATVSRDGAGHSAPHFRSLEELLRSDVNFSAIVLCTPPDGRHLLARAAISANKDVMLEKPPGTTVREVEELAAFARMKKRALYASWHSREGPAVRPAREWLAARVVRSILITWHEDVQFWHPGQEWIFQAGGFGVFDPGINALSLLTKLFPDCIVTSADLYFPVNREAPIAARISMNAGHIPIVADFDFRQKGLQTWEIRLTADTGELVIANGGSQMVIDGEAIPLSPENEYPSLYAEFADLIHSRESSIDVSPLQLVADTFLLGRRHQVEAFHFV